MTRKTTADVPRVAHGHTALLILDMISDFRFQGWRPVLAAARAIAPRIARLAARTRAAGMPVIYVNDTAGQWESDQAAFVQHRLAAGTRGRDVVRIVAPAPQDYFIFKLRHSGFYGTPLPQLLEKLGTRRLILTGITSHQCVLFTAMDAYVRDFQLVIPRDCVAAGSRSEDAHAMFLFRKSLRARTPMAASLRLRM
jgi:nicotinamidase-related amidase